MELYCGEGRLQQNTEFLLKQSEKAKSTTHSLTIGFRQVLHFKTKITPTAQKLAAVNSFSRSTSFYHALTMGCGEGFS
jgi:hypothetical protein